MHKKEKHIRVKSNNISRLYLIAIKSIYSSCLEKLSQEKSLDCITKKVKFEFLPYDLLFYKLLQFLFAVEKYDNLMLKELDITINNDLILYCVFRRNKNDCCKCMDVQIENIRVVRNDNEFILDAYILYINN